MQKESSTLETIKKLPKIYDRVFIVVLFLVIGVFVMQAISGNLKTQSPQEDSRVIPCSRTPYEKLQEVDRTELRTLFELSEPGMKEELFKTNLGKNEVPAITNPQFGKIDELKDCILDNSEVVVVSFGNETKVYPQEILAQHLVINDKVEGKNIIITYCALCNNYNVYSARIKDEVLTFGVSGYLYKNSDLIFDTKTESLWSIFSGKSLVGNYLGSQLQEEDFLLMSFSQVKQTYPNAKVLNFDTGFDKNYADITHLNFSKNSIIYGPIVNSSARLSQKEVVLGFEINNKYYAIPLSVFNDNDVFKATVDSQTLLITTTEKGFEGSLNQQKLKIKQSFWYVWFDHHPDSQILGI